MKVPNVENAVIAPEKVRDYLLNLGHRRGGPKARLLHSFGYRRADWSRLARDIREQHLSQPVSARQVGPYGTRYEIVAPLRTPDGRRLLLRSVWQIDTGTNAPRLITIVPE
jgi:hypothetical protein